KYGDYLKKKMKLDIKPGDIIDKSGKIIGGHKGAALYTIGQREGLGIAYKEPLYVVGIDVSANRITAGIKKDVYKKALMADKVNWVSIKKPVKKIRAQVKIRYQHKKAGAIIEVLESDKALVTFDEPQQAPTPGQAAVFYRGDTILGGGWIMISQA
ncbi:MAG: aminomethyltransferase beta-barrel domain-containing protein, partial [Candidatus Omnitrophota bacterium]